MNRKTIPVGKISKKQSEGVRYTLLQTAFSAILPTGKMMNRKSATSPFSTTVSIHLSRFELKLASEKNFKYT